MHDRHEWLGLPDGRVADMPFGDVVAAVARILDEEEPAVVVTFGPDGVFGNPFTSRSVRPPTRRSRG